MEIVSRHAVVSPLQEAHPAASQRIVAATLITASFAVLFHEPLTGMVSDWWSVPEAGHGLLLAPAALWLAWRAGRHPLAAGQLSLGLAILGAAVLLRSVSGLAAEAYTMRLSMIAALVGLTVFFSGMRQVLHWWLPFVLLALAVPLPELITQALALPLQYQASRLGAALLEMRHVPVHLEGNVIRIPGHELFVTEACSGLRSLTALISMAVLIGAVFLRSSAARVIILLLAIPIAIVVNGVRVFITGFLVHFVDASFGSGFMHVTEGWLLFLASLGVLSGFVMLGVVIERRNVRGRAHA